MLDTPMKTLLMLLWKTIPRQLTQIRQHLSCNEWRGERMLASVSYINGECQLNLKCMPSTIEIVLQFLFFAKVALSF